VISIVFGAGGILMSLYGMAMPYIVRFAEDVAPKAPIDPFAADTKWMWWLVGIHAVGVLAAIALLVGGIGPIRRRAWAARTIVMWAIARLPIAAGIAAVTFLMQRDQYRAMSQGTSTPMPAAFGDIMSSVVLVLTLGWYSALPVFMLIWFCRKPVRATVAKWRAGERA
jgi:hypothetical protein